MWDNAVKMNLEVEVLPENNIAAAVATVVIITHDGENLYVAFEALDPQPHLIKADNTERDMNHPDDWVGITIDANNDANTSYQLSVNPLGTRTDAITNQAEKTFDKG